MPLASESIKIAIAGATSLRGKDLKQSLEESGFAAKEIRLIDEELAAGTLTVVAGEPALVQAVDEASFEGARFAFFTGSAQLAAGHGAEAERAGATVIDLSGGLASLPGACPWIPLLDFMLPPPATSRRSRQPRTYISPSTPAIVACMLSAAMARFSPSRLVIVFIAPVSERGQAGVEELEAQTGKLLTFQPMPQEVFDAQVAFNLLDRWGPGSGESLSEVRETIGRQVRAYLDGRMAMPAITLVQAPTFYGHAFSAYAEFPERLDRDALSAQLARAGFAVAGDGDPAPTNISVAGEARPAIGLPVPDSGVRGGYWLWGAADNMRVATANAVRIAEALLAS